jgi:inner membrane protein
LDSLTHIVLGACIGEAVAGKKIGKKALIAGAIAQSLPDIDFVSTFWLSESRDILSHRGITHSIAFAIVATFAFAALARRFLRKPRLTWKEWFLLFGLNLFTHLFIDGFNAYGVGWLEPFSHHRFSFHILFVADPFFSIWPFIACIAIIYLKATNVKRVRWALLGIGMSAIYLLYATANKLYVTGDVRKSMAKKGISRRDYFITPAPFNSWLWFVVIKENKGYQVAYRSVFDRKKEISYTFFPRNDSLLQLAGNKQELKDMLTFADEFYTVEKRNDTLVFNVLRFGQVVGWYDPYEKLAFYYYLDCPGSNKVVAQRGRFEKWNRQTLAALFRRIRGQ